ncbi:MAG: hypothetical protein IV085_01735 [Thiobacillus sp.]|nr:hypothetical protein [Thiobacillus sp.]
MSQQINLANPQLLKPRYAFGLREMAIGIGAALAAMLAWSGVLYYQAGVQETQAMRLEASQADAQQALDRVTANANRAVSPLLTERIKMTQAHIQEREKLVAAINATLDQTSSGFASRLRALAHSSMDGVWLNGLTLAPDHIELKGSVLNAGLLTTYIDRLGKQAAFSGTTFSGMTAAQSTSTGKPDDASASTSLPDHLDFSLYAGTSPVGTAGGRP